MALNPWRGIILAITVVGWQLPLERCKASASRSQSGIRLFLQGVLAFVSENWR